MIDVSIIIVNYNSFSLLDNCLRTLFLETKEITFEVIVVDNGSTEEGIDEVISKYPKVKLITNKTIKGFAAANNQGFEEASGKYILMLNNDVVFIEDVISKVIKFSKENDDKIIIGCKLLNEDRTHQISVVDFDTIPNLFGENLFLYKLFRRSKTLNKYYLNDESIKEPIEVDAVKGAFLFLSNTVLKKLGGLDERFFFYYEETDLCYRWKHQGGKVYYYPNAELIHIGGASTDTNFWFKFRNQHISKIQFLQKHFRGIKLLLAVSIHELGLLLRFPLYFVIGLIRGNKSLIIKSGCYLRSIFVYPAKNQKAIA